MSVNSTFKLNHNFEEKVKYEEDPVKKNINKNNWIKKET